MKCKAQKKNMEIHQHVHGPLNSYKQALSTYIDTDMVPTSLFTLLGNMNGQSFSAKVQSSRATLGFCTTCQVNFRTKMVRVSNRMFFWGTGRGNLGSCRGGTVREAYVPPPVSLTCIGLKDSQLTSMDFIIGSCKKTLLMSIYNHCLFVFFKILGGGRNPRAPLPVYETMVILRLLTFFIMVQHNKLIEVN